MKTTRILKSKIFEGEEVVDTGDFLISESSPGAAGQSVSFRICNWGISGVFNTLF